MTLDDFKSGHAAELIAANQVDVKVCPARMPGRGEVLLQVRRAGVCGTDVALWRGYYPVALPLVLGHEFSAEVAAVGEGVDLAWRGRRVACEINNSCIAYGHTEICEACRRGMPNHCLTRTVVGIINHPGAFATWLTVPAGSLHRLPDEISDDAAVFIEPLAAAIRTFELTPIAPSDWVLVLGAGRLGRLIALVAHKLSARVITVARSRASLEFVREFSDLSIQYNARGEPAGFAEQVADMAQLREIVLTKTAGMGADVVVEATGQNDLLDQATTLARAGGTVCLKSTSGLPVRDLNTTLHTVNEIRFQGSRCGPFDKAIAFMQEHNLPNESWISERFPLSEIDKALAAAETLPKVLLDIGD